MFVEERLAEITERRIAQGWDALSPREVVAEHVSQALFKTVAGGPGGLRYNADEAERAAVIAAAHEIALPEFESWLRDVFATPIETPDEMDHDLWDRFSELEPKVYDRLETFLDVPNPRVHSKDEG